MLEHEYSLLSGFNRAKVGRYISLASASVSAGIVFILLWAVDIAQKFGLPANVPPAILSLVGAGAVFVALYWLFDKYAWKWGLVANLLKVPDLSGKWTCQGQSLDLNGNVTFPWVGEIIIVQSWDKIRVRLTTKQSGSNSNSAAIICDEAEGYRLFYSYKNDPKISETDLHSHRGFAELTFNKAVNTAEGEYFNGYGRYTFGRMKLERL
jgi:hypothetical protein